MDLLRYTIKSVWLFIAAIIFVGLAGLFLPQMNKHHSYQASITELETEIKDGEESLKQLNVKQQRFRTDKNFVEHVAHELGMVKPGEILFKIQDPSIPAN